MKTASIRDLRNHYTELLAWVAEGEEVRITRRGTFVARILPPGQTASPAKCDWKRSAAFTRIRWSRKLTARESRALLAENQGNF
jgi:prevent-host-death family protein